MHDSAGNIPDNARLPAGDSHIHLPGTAQVPLRRRVLPGGVYSGVCGLRASVPGHDTDGGAVNKGRFDDMRDVPAVRMCRGCGGAAVTAALQRI